MTQAPRDAGLQGERTALSWNRTALSLAVNALLALRTGWVAGQPVLLVVGIVLLAIAAAAVIFGNRRGRMLAGHTDRSGTASAAPAPLPATVAAIASAAVVLACCAGVASVLVEH